MNSMYFPLTCWSWFLLCCLPLGFSLLLVHILLFYIPRTILCFTFKNRHRDTRESSAAHFTSLRSAGMIWYLYCWLIIIIGCNCWFRNAVLIFLFFFQFSSARKQTPLRASHICMCHANHPNEKLFFFYFYFVVVVTLSRCLRRLCLNFPRLSLCLALFRFICLLHVSST